MINDEYEVDLEVFGEFVNALVRRYCASTHLILRSLLEGSTATALVLVERGGGVVSALDEPPETRSQGCFRRPWWTLVFGGTLGCWWHLLRIIHGPCPVDRDAGGNSRSCGEPPVGDPDRGG